LSHETLSIIFFRALSEARRRKDVLYGTINAREGELFWYYLGGFFPDPRIIIVNREEPIITLFLVKDIATKHRRLSDQLRNILNETYLGKIKLIKLNKNFLIPVSLSDEFRCKIFSIIACEQEITWKELLEKTVELSPIPSAVELEEHIEILNMAGLVDVKYVKGEKVIIPRKALQLRFDPSSCGEDVKTWEMSLSRDTIQGYSIYLYRVCELLSNRELRRRILEYKKKCVVNISDDIDYLLIEWGLAHKIAEKIMRLIFIPRLVVRDLRGQTTTIFSL